MKFQPIQYEQGKITLIDQTQLPERYVLIECEKVEDLWYAIKRLSVRGAPLLGVAAAYGLCLGLDEKNIISHDDLFAQIEELSDYIASSRPTAVNLFWALERMQKTAHEHCDVAVDEIKHILRVEADAIFDEDIELSKKIGAWGNTLINDGDTVLTHCNAGGLATSGFGTACAVFFTAHDEGKKIHVYADETRPLLQGARLTAWEMKQYGIPVTVLCDNMAASLMAKGEIDKIIVGADRIAANGDAANKIGTYSLAVLAQYHAIPFYIAAPYSTFDFSLATGEEIIIEQRDGKEVTHGFGKKTAPDGVAVYNPAFDVTPASLITGIITEKAIFMAPYAQTLAQYQQDCNG